MLERDEIKLPLLKLLEQLAMFATASDCDRTVLVRPQDHNPHA